MLPGHRPRIFLKNMLGMSSIVPPRLMAASFRTCWNGWMTSRRFQTTGFCMFSCGGQDAIEHYAICPNFHALCRKHLRLPCPAHGKKLPIFLALEHNTQDFDASTMPPDMDAAVGSLSLRALATYACYMTHNACRHGVAHGVEAEQAFGGFVQEGCKAQSKLLGYLTHVRLH